MASNILSIPKQIILLVEPILEELCFELVDVEYLTNYGRWILRLYIDKEGGVTLDDCARVSREIGHLLDVKDVNEHEYVLEISSPGLNRPLKKEKDFIRAVGNMIKVRTTKPVNGRRNYTGSLSQFKNDTLFLEMDGGLMTINRHEIDKANLVYDAD